MSAPGPGSNPYHVRLSELEKYRPMTATGRSPLDPADEDDLLPTSIGQVLEEAEQRPSMLTVEGEIWAFGKIAEVAVTGTGPRAKAARIWMYLLLLPFVGAVIAELIHLVGMH